MQGLDRVKAEVQRIIEEDYPEVFIVEIILRRSGKSVLSIALDTDEGIGIGTCAHISRKLNILFDEEEGENLFDFPFRLEVSSPGVGSPLLVKRQYTKNVGRKIKVTLLDGEIRKGILKSADEDSITVEPKAPKKKKKKKGEQEELQPFVLTFEEIKEAIIEISFD